ncbi:hypothetical protein MTR67_032163 [Solanum verrucosum]|uniref:Uncharacterized protein n=1 Tax=Solanum verrucosum TaxID=315347 RepID=A0AAF0ZHH4_SOLVR|nr:hypothetical protein MTR67_032163 [Solanum verrucosum]
MPNISDCCDGTVPILDDRYVALRVFLETFSVTPHIFSVALLVVLHIFPATPHTFLVTIPAVTCIYFLQQLFRQHECFVHCSCNYSDNLLAVETNLFP